MSRQSRASAAPRIRPYTGRRPLGTFISGKYVKWHFPHAPSQVMLDISVITGLLPRNRSRRRYFSPLNNWHFSPARIRQSPAPDRIALERLCSSRSKGVLRLPLLGPRGRRSLPSRAYPGGLPKSAAARRRQKATTSKFPAARPRDRPPKLKGADLASAPAECRHESARRTILLRPTHAGFRVRRLRVLRSRSAIRHAG